MVKVQRHLPAVAKGARNSQHRPFHLLPPDRHQLLSIQHHVVPAGELIRVVHGPLVNRYRNLRKQPGGERLSRARLSVAHSEGGADFRQEDA